MKYDRHWSKIPIADGRLEVAAAIDDKEVGEGATMVRVVFSEMMNTTTYPQVSVRFPKLVVSGAESLVGNIIVEE